MNEPLCLGPWEGKGGVQRGERGSDTMKLHRKVTDTSYTVTLVCLDFFPKPKWSHLCLLKMSNRGHT